MSEPPADILRRLKPIPTYTGHPTTAPTTSSAWRPTALLAGSMWWRPPRRLCSSSSGGLPRLPGPLEGLRALRAGLAGAARLVVVARSPGEESPEAIAALAGDAPLVDGIDLVMSSEAYRDYRVTGPPFLTVVAPDGVRTEGVAWGVEETVQTALKALPAG